MNFRRVLRRKKTRRIITAVVFLAMVSAIIILGLYAMQLREYKKFAEAYSDRFLEKTFINGIDVSGKTAEEAKEALLGSPVDYSLELLFREDRKETIQAQEIGCRYVSAGDVASLMEGQDPESWLKASKENDGQIPSAEMKVDMTMSFDEQKLKDRVLSLPELQDFNMEEPQDASMVYQEAKYVVIPENPGTTLHPDAVLQAVSSAVTERQQSLDLTEIKGIYTDPKKTMKTVGEDLQKQADELNELVPGSVTYLLPNDRKMVLDGTVMRSWLKKDYDGSLYRDEYEFYLKLENYVETMANSVNTVGKTRTFQTTGKGEIRISGGNYGYEIDQEAELEKLTEELANGSVVIRKPEYSSWETSEENNGFGNSYVEIDCSRQHLWIYVDGEVVLETDVVTGLMTPKMATPAGTCLLYGKERDAELIGERFEYRTNVSYWMPFNGGVGMHDAWWRSEFGGDIYLWDGSNGCINMPTDMAEKAFEIVTVDMPIVVYYSEEYELY